MKIGFKNLRSLKETGLIEIKPLTLLLGQNSSGKSTFLRTFPLLKQSLETKTKGPILWYGKFVDFGDFDTAKTDNVNDDFIELMFQIEFNKKLESRRYYFHYGSLWHKIFDLKLCDFSIKLKSEKEFTTFASEINFKFHDFQFQISFEKENQISKVLIDEIPIVIDNIGAYSLGNGLLPKIVLKQKERIYVADGNFQLKKIVKKIQDISKKPYKQNTIDKILSNFSFKSKTDLFNSIVQCDDFVGFYNNVKNLDENSTTYIELKTLLLSSFIPFLMENIDNYLTEIADKTSYIAPLRATAERYYRPQELNLDEVDFQGKNLALVLVNLSDMEKRRFKEWCLENFDFHPEATIKGGNISINVIFKDDTSKHNITDLGFGFSQILPIITQIWTSIVNPSKTNYNKKSLQKVYAIEQPELHLHPKLQGKLVDAIVKALDFCEKQDFQVKFVIETHSETIINAIGNRIYKGMISSNTVNVVLFERKSRATSVKEVNYLEDGSLEHWPYGFFEEDFLF